MPLQNLTAFGRLVTASSGGRKNTPIFSTWPSRDKSRSLKVSNRTNQVHLAVVLENDPGRDLGLMRHPGHRFFFSPQEIEPPGLDREARK
jgi:hypothetical protein